MRAVVGYQYKLGRYDDVPRHQGRLSGKLFVLLACGHRVDWMGQERDRRRCESCSEAPGQEALGFW